MFRKIIPETKMEINDIEPRNTLHTIQARLVSETGEEAGPPIDLPINVNVTQLGLICNALLKNVRKPSFES